MDKNRIDRLSGYDRELNSPELKWRKNEIEQEQQMLGLLLLCPWKFEQFRGLTKKILVQAHRDLYAAIESCCDGPGFEENVIDELKRMGCFDRIGGIALLFTLVDSISGIDNDIDSEANGIEIEMNARADYDEN